MYFAIMHSFREGVGEKRAAVRPAHLDYLKDCGERMMLAGPMKETESDDAPNGSLIVIRADSETAARLFVEHDPYVLNGLVAMTDIRPFDAVLGTWVQ